jgi:hypothetical protein
MWLKNLILVLFLYSMLLASETIDRVKGFLPTVTESATLANMVNVYMKISDWVRATNAVVKGMRSAIDDVRSAKYAVEDIIATAQAMKEFNLYDMDSWATTVWNAKMIVGPYTTIILNEMGDFSAHAIGGVNDYIGELDNVSNFDIRDKKNAKRRLISREFSPEDDESYLEGMFSQIKSEDNKYALLEQQKANLEVQREEVKVAIDRMYLSSQKEILQDSLKHIDRRINRIEKKIIIQKSIADGLSYTVKLDTIVSDAKELMSGNMIQTEIIFGMLGQLDEQAAELMNDIRRLAEDKISGSAKGGDVKAYAEMTGDIFSVKDKNENSIYGEHPNQAPKPQSSGKSTPYSFGEMDKAEVNTQDVIQTRNQINLILLRQEKYLRDIEAMKANSMAYLMLIDGSNRSKKLAAKDAVKLYSRYHSEIAGELSKGFIK